MVFQSYALFPHMTVLENVSYGLADAALSKAQRLDKAREGLRLVGLEGYDERLPSELSGGQQQRVACARALVLEPQVLLFDEPLSNLDAKLRRRMREEIRDLQQKLHLTSIYVTHDQEEALAVSDKIVVMNKGRIAQEGTPVDLYERPADSFVADFIGGANLIPCEIVRREDEAALVRFGNTELRVAAPRVDGSAGYLVVRSAAVALTKANGAAGLTATVRKATYLGGHWEYTLDTPSARCSWRSRSASSSSKARPSRCSWTRSTCRSWREPSDLWSETSGTGEGRPGAAAKGKHPMDKRSAGGLATCPCCTRFIGRPPNPVQWAFLKGPEA